jgi:hypothetical protein
VAQSCPCFSSTRYRDLRPKFRSLMMCSFQVFALLLSGFLAVYWALTFQAVKNARLPIPVSGECQAFYPSLWGTPGFLSQSLGNAKRPIRVSWVRQASYPSLWGTPGFLSQSLRNARLPIPVSGECRASYPSLWGATGFLSGERQASYPSLWIQILLGGQERFRSTQRVAERVAGTGVTDLRSWASFDH